MNISLTTSVFVSYASCVEEKEYCQEPDKVLPFLFDRITGIGEQLIETYKAVYGRDLRDALFDLSIFSRNDSESVRHARATQLSLYILALDVLMKSHKISSATAFSAGFGPLFVASRSLGVNEWLSRMYSLIAPYSFENLAIRSAGHLHTKLFCSYSSSNFDEFVTLAAADIDADLTIKDDRGPYAIQLTGSEKSLSRLTSVIEEAFPDSTITSSGIIQTDAAHIKPERYIDVSEQFMLLNMRPPSIEIATHTGEILGENHDRRDCANALFDALYAPLRMKNVNRYLSAINKPVIHIGSCRTARFAFYGFGEQLFPSPLYHWENVLMRGYVDKSILTPQDRPNW